MKNPKEDTVLMVQSKGRKKNDDIDTIINNLIDAIQEYNLMIE